MAAAVVVVMIVKTRRRAGGGHYVAVDREVINGEVLTLCRSPTAINDHVDLTHGLAAIDGLNLRPVVNRGTVAANIPSNRGISRTGPVSGIQPTEIAAGETDRILTEVAAGERGAGALDRDPRRTAAAVPATNVSVGGKSHYTIHREIAVRRVCPT